MDVVLTQDFFPKFGGAHLWLYEVYKRWISPVHMITHDYELSSCAQSSFDKRDHSSLSIHRYNIEIERINLFNIGCIIKFLRVASIIKDVVRGENCNIHVLRAFPEGFAAVIYKKLYNRNTKIITYAHGEEIQIAKSSRQLTWISKIVFKNSCIVIANSKNTSNLISNFYCQSNVSVVHPGVDFSSFSLPKEDIKKTRYQWDRSGDSVILFSIGRMEPRKNHANVLRAIAPLILKGFKLKYIIGSDGEERNSLESLSVELGINHHVHFTGYVSDADRIRMFCSADIHLMPSVDTGEMLEGFGIVFIEAAAAGIPSISGTTGGQKEAVIHGKTGLNVDGNSVEAIESAIECLINNRSLKKLFGKNGRRWAQSLDWNNVAFEIKKLVNVELNKLGAS